ncbi:hypothetical protein Hanom_Chr09g00781511 [Helianthus anomalus]
MTKIVRRQWSNLGWDEVSNINKDKNPPPAINKVLLTECEFCNRSLLVMFGAF